MGKPTGFLRGTLNGSSGAHVVLHAYTGTKEATRPTGRGKTGARGYAAGVIGSVDSSDDGIDRSMPYSLILVRRVL